MVLGPRLTSTLPVATSTPSYAELSASLVHLFIFHFITFCLKIWYLSDDYFFMLFLMAHLETLGKGNHWQLLSSEQEPAFTNVMLRLLDRTEHNRTEHCSQILLFKCVHMCMCNRKTQQELKHGILSV